jgi:glycosyltransferase involved in cell wall biosynthesis
MHVCLICIELFGDSIYGGFGRATRFIGRALVQRGIRVSVVTPRRSPARPDHYGLDGMEVHQFAPSRPWRAIEIFRTCRADLYHAQDASSTMVLARLAEPRAAHVVTFRDPLSRLDWQVETAHAGMPALGWALYRSFIANPMVTRAIRHADARYCAALFLIPKTVGMYGLRSPPTFLASPVAIPEHVVKAAKPTVCFVGRFEGRKRVDLFFELARACPDVDFVAIGGARDPAQDASLRARYGGIPNLTLPGVLDQFSNEAWSEHLGRSWVLVNTSLREGLPTTFIEAAAHRCAILSFTDPDGFASRFGVQAAEGELQAGLRHLLAQDRWRERGEAGWHHVSAVYSVEAAIDAHLEAYRQVLQR